MGGESFRMDAGVDLAPLLEGLENDLCQSPRWGSVIDGELTVSYEGGSSEKVRTGAGRFRSRPNPIAAAICGHFLAHV